MKKKGYKDRFYDFYVSSGQARLQSSSPEAAFRPRAPWFRSIIRRHFPMDRAAKVVDLGCGHGPFLYFMGEAGFVHVTGVDASPEQVEAAKRMGIAGIEEGDVLDFVRELDEDSVDVVLSIDLLEHLSGADLLDLADEVQRVLRSDGRWVIHVPNAEGPFGLGIRYGDLTHERAFSPSSIQQLCQTAGFTKVHVFPDPPVIHGIRSLLRWILWTAGMLPVRVLFAAETGRLDPVLTRNLLAVVYR